MKKHFYTHTAFLLLTVFMLVGCSSMSDCLSDSGAPKKLAFDLPEIEGVVLNPNMSLHLVPSENFRFEIDTRSRLESDFSWRVEEGMLILEQNQGCTWSRGYGMVHVTVYAPNLKRINTYSEGNITNEGVLTWPELHFRVLERSGAAPSGEIKLNILNQRLTIESNTVAYTYVEGQTQLLQLLYYGGIGRCDTRNLQATEADIFHRSSNDLFINVSQRVSGQLLSTGHLWLAQTPETLDVTTTFTGQVRMLN
jgi:hypothetical protein